MFANLIVSALGLASLAAAHFTIEYPEMRGDSFAEGASQYIYPCANVNQTAATNRTLWPLTGGSLSLHLHHPWTYVFMNLGLGTDYPVFNVSLTGGPILNVTGNGTYALSAVALPFTPVEGQNASVQIVTVGASGSALYNCADITFSSKGTVQTGELFTNTSTVHGTIVTATSTNASSTTNTSAPASSTTKSAGVSTHSISIVSSGAFAGLAAVVVSWLL